MRPPTKLPDGRPAFWHWYLKPLLAKTTDPIARFYLELEIKAQQARVRELWREAKSEQERVR